MGPVIRSVLQNPFYHIYQKDNVKYCIINYLIILYLPLAYVIEDFTYLSKRSDAIIDFYIDLHTC